MRSTLSHVAAVSLALFALLTGITGSADAALSAYESDVLKVCEGVVRLFEERGDEIWPGYSLAERPFVVYIPKRWVLLFNAGRDVEGFGPCPPDWPDLGRDVLYHEGSYGNLVGQLAFGHDVDGVRTVAIGFPESLPESMENVELKMLGYIVHEAFHEYQDEFFGETPWAREQRYPIDDRENAALAYLEMALLIDALEAVRDGAPDRCGRSVARFLAVRDHRWREADPFVTTYEQGKEVREGTARYVELLSFDGMRDLAYTSSVDGSANPLAEHFASAAMPGYLIARFADRMGDGYVPIGDLFRNRIYPVGSAQAFLLDHLGVEWRTLARDRTAEFTYAEILRDGLGVDPGDLPALFEEAKDLHDYATILRASEREVDRYHTGYRREMEVFESQFGDRVEIELSSNGVYRSRVSTADKWVVDRGTKALCGHYKVYTLESDALFLEVHGAALYEENDWDGYRKRVVFYDPSIVTLRLDGEPLKRAGDVSRTFRSIEIEGERFGLTCSSPGSISVTGERVSVNLVPPPD